MDLSVRHVFTLEHIADRWRVGTLHVHELVYSRQLPQAFVISGPARLVIQHPSGKSVPHPGLELPAARTRLIVSAQHTMPDEFCWPLQQVRRIYEFVGGDQLGRLSLLQYCDYDRCRQLGWSIRFEPEHTTIEGRDTVLVSLKDLLEYESRWNIVPASERERQESARLRDNRRQRCRVAAAIIWQDDPGATLPQVYQHDWVQLLACEGQPPTEKSFREWVKDLNPNRSPGRRRTQPGS